MPELRFNDESFFGDTMRFSDRNTMTFGGMVAGNGKASMTQHEHHQILEPKLRSTKDMERFIDQPNITTMS